MYAYFGKSKSARHIQSGFDYALNKQPKKTWWRMLFQLLTNTKSGRFTLAKLRNRPCASQNEFTYSPRGTQCNNPLVHQRSSNYCPLAKFWPKKSKEAPNPKIGFFSNEGQLQIIFRRNMHRGPKLEQRLWRSGCLSWVPLGETVDWFWEAYCWFPQFMGQKRTWTQKKSKSNGIKYDPHRKRPSNRSTTTTH